MKIENDKRVDLLKAEAINMKRKLEEEISQLTEEVERYTVISVLSPQGAYFFPNIIQGGLIERGAYSKYIQQVCLRVRFFFYLP